MQLFGQVVVGFWQFSNESIPAKRVEAHHHYIDSVTANFLSSFDELDVLSDANQLSAPSKIREEEFVSSTD